MRELTLLAEALRLLDTNAEFSLVFYHKPENHYRVVMGLLFEEIAKTARARDLRDSEAQSLMNMAANQLMDKFWPHCYPAHDCHFHKSFEEFVNCPFTCLTEICDCVEKISKGANQ